MSAKMIACGLLLSLASAVPVGATIITVDDFTNDTLDANWVHSNVDYVSGSSGTYSFDTTTVDDKLAISMSGFSGVAIQDVLLRDDYCLDVNQTLLTDYCGHATTFDNGTGLFISTATGVTSKNDAIWIRLRPVSGVVSAYHKDHAGTVFKEETLCGSIDGLYISRTNTNQYDMGYYQGDSFTSVFSVAIDTSSGNLCPGAAIGYFADIRTNSYATFDNLRLDVVPEPSTLALLAFGMIGFLAYAWRKRK